MSAHEMNGTQALTARVEELEDRADSADSWRKSTDKATADRAAELFVLLTNMHGDMQDCLSLAKSTDSTVTLLAAQYRALHGDVVVTRKDLEVVRGAQKDIRKAQKDLGDKHHELAATQYRDKLESHHDLEDTQRRAVMSATEAAKAIAKEEAKNATTSLHLDIVQGQVAEVKEESRHQSRFLQSNRAKWVFALAFVFLSSLFGIIGWLANMVLAAKGLK